MKKFFAEFKEFISRGNVVDLAVGMIIGSAFTAIVKSLVENIVTPLIGVLLGGLDFSGLNFTIGNAVIEIGLFVNAVITFLLTALVLFCVVKTMNRFKRKKEEEPKEEEPAPTPEDILLLQEIRDLLKEQQSQAEAVSSISAIPELCYSFHRIKIMQSVRFYPPGRPHFLFLSTIRFPLCRCHFS